MKKPTKKKKVVKADWNVFPQAYAIREIDMFDMGAVIIPVICFMNKNTGEIKQFVKSYVDKNGTQMIIDYLNNL